MTDLVLAAPKGNKGAQRRDIKAAMQAAAEIGKNRPRPGEKFDASNIWTVIQILFWPFWATLKARGAIEIATWCGLSLESLYETLCSRSEVHLKSVKRISRDLASS